jgi:uncharacterized protein YciI
MLTYFAVRRRPGPAWNAAVSMQAQALWSEHVAFMNMLEAEGFIVLGGPVGSGEDALLVINAANEEAVIARLALDPWSESRLRIDSIERWTILLDGRSR